MYSSFWSDLKHTLLSQWWVLLVLCMVLSVNMILKVSAADDVETVYYLDFCGNQLQMFREFVKLDGSKVYTDQNCILVNHPLIPDTDSAGNDLQLISQYIISNRYFEVLENDKIIKPTVKIGNLYAAKIHDCINIDLCMLQGGTLLFDGSDTLENEIALFYNAEIENLIYEDTSLGATDIEHALVIEPEPVQENPAEEDPVQEPEPVQQDLVQEPEPVKQDPVQEPELEPVQEDPVQEQELEPVQEDPVQEPELEPVQEDPVQEQELEPVQEDLVQEPELEPVQEDPVQEQEQAQEVKQSTTIVRSASSSGNVSEKQTNATATYADSMEGSPVIKSTNTSSQSSTSSTVKATEAEKVDETKSSDSGNASTVKTSIDGEENVDDTTLHNDNIMLTVALFVLGGLGVAMGITHLML